MYKHCQIVRLNNTGVGHDGPLKLQRRSNKGCPECEQADGRWGNPGGCMLCLS